MDADGDTGRIYGQPEDRDDHFERQGLHSRKTVQADGPEHEWGIDDIGLNFGEKWRDYWGDVVQPQHFEDERARVDRRTFGDDVDLLRRQEEGCC